MKMEHLQNNFDRQLSILKAINEKEEPVGAIYLSETLEIPSATIGRILIELERDGFLKKESNKGRVITPKGKKYLEEKNNLHIKMSAAHNIINTGSDSKSSNLKEVLELRKLLEGYAAMKCAQNCSDEQIAVLENLNAVYVEEIKNSNTGSAEDLKLHLKIAEFSGNETLKNMLRLLLTDNASYESFSNAAYCRNRLYLNEHDMIISAIKNKDSKGAKKEMEKHLERVTQNILSCISK